MRPITGGNVPPDRVVGRDDFIDQMWRALENQSVVLVAERRIGKTSVIRKMAAEPCDNWYPVYLVVENSPTNDMAVFPLGNLTQEDATALAVEGIKGLEEDGDMMLSDSRLEVAQHIATKTDFLPFYVNHAIAALSELDTPIRKSDVGRALNILLDDPGDRASFRHYAERIETYYAFGEKTVPLALQILNTLSQSRKRMSEEELLTAIATQIRFSDMPLLQKILGLLYQDHYLTRTLRAGVRKYQFKYGVIREWWQRNRG